jgi:hypothetical protein
MVNLTLEIVRQSRLSCGLSQLDKITFVGVPPLAASNIRGVGKVNASAFSGDASRSDSNTIRIVIRVFTNSWDCTVVCCYLFKPC